MLRKLAYSLLLPILAGAGEDLSGTWVSANKSNEAETITLSRNSGDSYLFEWNSVTLSGHTGILSGSANFKQGKEKWVATVQDGSCKLEIEARDDALLIKNSGKCTDLGAPLGTYVKVQAPLILQQILSEVRAIQDLQTEYYKKNGKMGYLRDIGYQFPTQYPFEVNGTFSAGSFNISFKNRECRDMIAVSIDKKTFQPALRIQDKRCHEEFAPFVLNAGISVR